MRILCVQPACPTGFENSVARASALSDVFEVVRPLAYHADCLVSLQRCRNSGTEVAVKTYPKLKLSKLAKEQAETEAFIHGSLVHEHIVPLLLAAEDERNIHLVVEWADGGDLREHIIGIGEQRLKELVVKPLLQALAVLDAQGVVHRDLKPDNVLVHQGSVRLSDFGLAVYHHGFEQQVLCCHPSYSPSSDASLDISSSIPDATLSCASSMPVSCRSSCSALDTLHDPHAQGDLCHAEEDLQRTTRIRSLPCVLMPRPASSAQLMQGAGGTPMYTAPEVLRAMFESRPINDVVTPKNDIWALGIMILEALTGCHPYSPSSTCVNSNMYSCNLLYAVAHHSGFRYPSHLSAEAVDFLRCALHVDPNLRPSATQLLAHPWLQPASCCLTPRTERLSREGVAGLSIRVSRDAAGGKGSPQHRAAVSGGGCRTPVSCKASVAISMRGSGGGRVWDSSECLEF